MDTKERIKQEITIIDEEIIKTQLIIDASCEQKRKLEETPLRLDNTSRKDALEAAREHTKSIEKLTENAKIATLAIEALELRKYQLKQRIEQLIEAEKEAEREKIAKEADEIVESINFLLWHIQSDLKKLLPLIERYQKTFHSDTPLEKRWLNKNDIGTLRETIDQFFFCWNGQRLVFSQNINGNYGNTIFYQNLVRIKSEIEDKINERRESKV